MKKVLWTSHSAACIAASVPCIPLHTTPTVVLWRLLVQQVLLRLARVHAQTAAVAAGGSSSPSALVQWPGTDTVTALQLQAAVQAVPSGKGYLQVFQPAERLLAS